MGGKIGAASKGRADPAHETGTADASAAPTGRFRHQSSSCVNLLVLFQSLILRTSCPQERLKRNSLFISIITYYPLAFIIPHTPGKRRTGRAYSPPLRCATIFRARAGPRRYKVLAALGVTAPRTGSPPLRERGQNSESSSRKSTTPMFNTPFSSYQRFLMSCRTTILGKESPISPKGLVSASILLSFSIA